MAGVDLGTYFVQVRPELGRGFASQLHAGVGGAVGVEAAAAKRTLGAGISEGAAVGAASATRSIGRVSNAAGALGGVLRRVGMGVGIATIGTQAVRAASGLEKAQASLSGLYGDAELARDTLSDLREVAQRSSLSFDAYRQAGDSLAYAGIQGEQAVTILDNVGRAIVGAGGGSEDLERASDALLRMVNRGKVGLRELQQLSNANVPILSALSDELGVHISQVSEMATAGAIGMEDVYRAMENAAGDSWAMQIESAERVEATFGATWERMKDSVGLTLGEAVLPFLETITPAFEVLGDAIGRIPGPIATIATGAAALTAGQALLSRAIGRTAGAFGAQTTAAVANARALDTVTASSSRAAGSRGLGAFARSGVIVAGLWAATEAATRLRDVFREVVLPTTGEGYGAMVAGSSPEELVGRIESSRGVYDGWGRVMQFGDWATGLVGIGDGTKDLDAGIKNIDRGLAELVGSGNMDVAEEKFEALAAALRDRGWTESEIAEAFPAMSADADDLAGSLHGVEGAVGSAADAFDDWAAESGLELALENAERAASEVEEALDDVHTAASRALGGHLSVEEAQDQQTRAQKDLNAAIKEARDNGYTGDYMDLADTSTVALDLRDKQRDLERATGELADAWAEAGVPASEIRDRLRDIQDEFENDNVWKGKEGIDHFASSLGVMRDELAKTGDALDAALDAERFRKAVALGLIAEGLRLNQPVSSRGDQWIESWDNPRGNMASGGRVQVGTLYNVQERGPEWFRADVSGQIIPLGDERVPEGGSTTNIHIYSPVTEPASSAVARADRARGTRIGGR